MFGKKLPGLEEFQEVNLCKVYRHLQSPCSFAEVMSQIWLVCLQGQNSHLYGVLDNLLINVLFYIYFTSSSFIHLKCVQKQQTKTSILKTGNSLQDQTRKLKTYVERSLFFILFSERNCSQFLNSV